jgi:hypothetical protein
MAKHPARAAAAIVACGLAMSAQAGEKTQFSSIVFGKQISETRLQLDGSNEYGTFAAEEVVVGTDLPDVHPLQNLTGKCTGVGERVEGKGKVGGHCVLANPDGGKVALSFVVDPALSPEWEGTFELTGLDGTARGWRASCKWGKTVQLPPDRYVQRWSCSAEKR